MNTPTGVDYSSLFPVLPTGNLWIDREYNVCIFYWNQFSDEPDIKVAEKKIYTKGPHRCALKSSTPNSGNGPETVSYTLHGDGSTSCISEQLHQEYVNYFSPEKGYTGKVIMVGHSLGAQLAIEAARRILLKEDHSREERNQEKDDAENAEKMTSLSKLVLLDPFFSNGNTSLLKMQTYTSNSVAARATNTLMHIAAQHPTIALETQIASVIGEGMGGGWSGFSCCSGLQQYTKYRMHALPDLCWMNVKDRHCISHHLFMCEIIRSGEEVQGGTSLVHVVQDEDNKDKDA